MSSTWVVIKILMFALLFGAIFDTEEQREQRKTDEQRERLSLFETELTVLGDALDEAVAMDELQLRRVFRARSRELHPDVIGDSAESTDAPGSDDEMLPSIYEINSAYEAVKKVLPRL